MSKVKKDFSGKSVVWLSCSWFPIALGFCPNQSAWDLMVKEMKLPSQEGDYPHQSSMGNGGDAVFTSFVPRGNEYLPFGIITLDHEADLGREAGEIMALLVHECVHAFQFLCQVIGETRPSDEFEAYSIQSIFQETQEAYSKTRWERAQKTKKTPRRSGKKARAPGKGRVPSSD